MPTHETANLIVSLSAPDVRLRALDRALQMYSTTMARELPAPDADGIVTAARTFENYLNGESK
ncbi:hypothetical protein SEA_SPEEDDEMON_1020 [Gordonia phage SpeedDemon]|nr:hypothetical protein SEA_SPEEDDEMON_1020 [Gordonia phage SpeedDemon]